MFCVIYRFSVKPGREVEFEAAWRALTALIRQHQHSLGSRLHRGETDYIAYAQWPTREDWRSPPALPPDADEPRAKMKDACSNIEVLHELEVVTDLLG